MRREVYMDNSATTKPFDEILENMGRIIGSCYGNPSSLHGKGLNSEKILKNTRQILGNSLDVDSGEIFFTSGGTESNNIAAAGVINAKLKKLGALITSTIEHPSVLEIFKHLQKKGHKVIYLPVDKDGIIDISVLEKHLALEQVTLVSIMHVNNEVGSIQPIDEIVKLKKRYGFILHLDAVQSYCKLEFKNICKDIDMLSLSGHKIHALKGIGGLYIKKGINIIPLYHGGGQEKGVRPGTENVSGIWSIGQAVEIIKDKKYGDFIAIRELKNYLINRIIEEVPEAVLNGSIDKAKSAPHIVNISFKGIPGEVMLHALEERGIYVSTGSACSSRKKVLSHVLSSMGIDRERIKSSVRFSLSLGNTMEDIEYSIDTVKECVKALK